MKETIDISQEKEGKENKKDLGYVQRLKEKNNRATEQQEETVWSDPMKDLGGKGLHSRLGKTEGWTGVARELVTYL